MEQIDFIFQIYLTNKGGESLKTIYLEKTELLKKKKKLRNLQQKIDLTLQKKELRDKKASKIFYTEARINDEKNIMCPAGP